MAVLSREAILAAQDIKVERVEVPEWGGHVFVRMLHGAERDRFEQSNVKVTRGKGGRVTTEPAPGNFRARLVALVACDETGKRIFADTDAADLGRKGSRALDRIVMAALALNGMADESVEEAEKNSENGQSESSTTGSP